MIGRMVSFERDWPFGIRKGFRYAHTHSQEYFQQAQEVLVGGVNSPVRSF